MALIVQEYFWATPKWARTLCTMMLQPRNSTQLSMLDLMKLWMALASYILLLPNSCITFAQHPMMLLLIFIWMLTPHSWMYLPLRSWIITVAIPLNLNHPRPLGLEIARSPSMHCAYNHKVLKSALGFKPGVFCCNYQLSYILAVNDSPCSSLLMLILILFWLTFIV